MLLFEKRILRIYMYRCHPRGASSSRCLQSSGGRLGWGFLGGVGPREVQLFHVSFTTLAFFFFGWYSVCWTNLTKLFLLSASSLPGIVSCRCEQERNLAVLEAGAGGHHWRTPGSSLHSASTHSPFTFPFCPLRGTGGGEPRHRNYPVFFFFFLPSCSYCTGMAMTREIILREIILNFSRGLTSVSQQVRFLCTPLTLAGFWGVCVHLQGCDICFRVYYWWCKRF